MAIGQQVLATICSPSDRKNCGSWFHTRAGELGSNERTAQIKSDLQSVEDILQQTAIFEDFEE